MAFNPFHVDCWWARACLDFGWRMPLQVGAWRLVWTCADCGGRVLIVIGIANCDGHVLMFKNVQKCSKMFKNVHQCSKMFPYGATWSVYMYVHVSELE